MRFQCPVCKEVTEAPDSEAGKQVKCGKCSAEVLAPTSRVSPGAVVGGDFCIKREIARGGMGIVYLARQISLDRLAALKIMQPEMAKDSTLVSGLIQEARLAAKLNHPNIVQAYAVGEDDGLVYFAMEYVDGPTMKTVLKEKKVLDFKMAAEVVCQIAGALETAWNEQKLTHRDIKPDNIIVSATSGKAKLADLGLSKAGDTGNVTDSGEVLGTPQYISPEQLTGAAIDTRSDIYSLGATFYQFVTGRFPYEGKDGDEIARQHVTGKFKPPAEVNPAVPRELNRIILKMMALNPENRYKDARELRKVLEAYLNSPAGAAASGAAAAPGGVAIVKVPVKPSVAAKRQIPRPAPVSEAETPQPVPKPVAVQKPEAPEIPEAESGTEAPAPEVPPRKSKNRLGLILVLLLVIAAAAGGVFYFNSRNGGKSAAPDAGSEPAGPESNFLREARGLTALFNEGGPEEVLKRCDGFFLRFAAPADAAERRCNDEIRSVYAALEETHRNPAAREKLKKSRRELIAERENIRAEAARAEEARKKAEAEAERALREARQRQEEQTREYMKNLESDLKITGVAFFEAIGRGDAGEFDRRTRDLTLFAAAAPMAGLAPDKLKIAEEAFATRDQYRENLKNILDTVAREGLPESAFSEVQFEYRDAVYRLDGFNAREFRVTDRLTDRRSVLDPAELPPAVLTSLARTADQRLDRENALFFSLMSRHEYADWMQNIAPSDTWKTIVQHMVAWKKAQ